MTGTTTVAGTSRTAAAVAGISGVWRTYRRMSSTRPLGMLVRQLSDAEPAREICVVHRRRPPALLARLIELVHRTAAEVAARTVGDG